MSLYSYTEAWTGLTSTPELSSGDAKIPSLDVPETFDRLDESISDSVSGMLVILIVEVKTGVSFSPGKAKVAT